MTGKDLRALRKELNLGQTAFGRLLGYKGRWVARQMRTYEKAIILPPGLRQRVRLLQLTLKLEDRPGTR